MRYCKKMYDAPHPTRDHLRRGGRVQRLPPLREPQNVDWDARFKEFEGLLRKYRGMNGPGGYDCAVAVSGGKDSHFQVWMLKEVMHMNPILFSVEDNFPMTQAASTTSRTSARSSAVRSSPASPTSRCKRR